MSAPRFFLARPLLPGFWPSLSVSLVYLHVVILVPLLVLLIFFGFFPRPLLQVADDAARNVMQTVGETDPAPTIQGEN